MQKKTIRIIRNFFCFTLNYNNYIFAILIIKRNFTKRILGLKLFNAMNKQIYKDKSTKYLKQK